MSSDELSSLGVGVSASPTAVNEFPSSDGLSSVETGISDLVTGSSPVGAVAGVHGVTGSSPVGADAGTGKIDDENPVVTPPAPDVMDLQTTLQPMDLETCLQAVLVDIPEGVAGFTDKPYYEFGDMGLRTQLLRGINAFGFDQPSPIQERGMVPFCKRFHVIEQAQPSAGRMAILCCGILNQLDYDLTQCQALVLAPSREVVQKIEKLMKRLGCYFGVKVHAFVGDSEDSSIRLNEIHVALGTPGTIFDLSDRTEPTLFDHIKVVAIDEAEQIFSTPLHEYVGRILRLLKPDLQVGVFSASLSNDTMETVKKLTKNAVRIRTTQDELFLEGIKHSYISFPREELKFEYVRDFLKNKKKLDRCAIFVNTSHKADELSSEMINQGLSVLKIDENTEQSEREMKMIEFRTAVTNALITTDQSGYGIDVQQVDFVINCDMPTKPENYLLRIGLSQRSRGKRHDVVNLIVTEEDKGLLSKIEDFYEIQMDECGSS